MGYGITPKLREPVVCEVPCEHRDCKANRELVTGGCLICGTRMGEGVMFYYRDSGAVHYDCAWAEADREVAAARATEEDGANEAAYDAWNSEQQAMHDEMVSAQEHDAADHLPFD